ncbi:SDR family oxidoreductase [Oscillatoria sp. CS-180]|uniref:SDR family oxidoreductase n=1 Tax=Oscillatoria sp. CS-180 TaxID=3021720 RepID=UPI00232D93C7|nr:SDR family oxidoreductase [Oscillatoria sp. CS-180]MDB9529234.1 SDR family oxidoreductase [Oscillatoria sp. CS-180]
MTSETQRRALITGASSGIGRETAIAFAKAGIDVALVARSQSKLETLTSELLQMGIEAKPYVIDLSQIETLQTSLSLLLEDFGSVNILINNAGMGYTGSLASMPLADWQKLMDLNLTSVFLVMQAVIPEMRAQGGGTIVNVASIAAHNAFPTWGAYSASKAGLVSLSRILGAEESENGIRVMTVSPGAVNTPLWDTETVQADFARSQMLTPAIVAQTILNAVQLPDSAVIDEITLMPSGGAL